MKKVKSGLIAKTIAWLLLVFFIFVFFTCIAGIALLLNTGAYWDGGRNFREVAAEQVFGFDRVRIRYIVYEYHNGTMLDDSEYREMYARENSNVFFVIKDSAGNTVVDYGSDEEYQIKYDYTLEHHLKGEGITEEKEFTSRAEAEAYVNSLEETYYVTMWSYDEESGVCNITYCEYEAYTVNAFIRKDFSAKDRYYYTLGAVNLVVAMRYWVILIGLASAVMCLLVIIFLCSSAGVREASGEYRLSFIHRIPLDLYLAFSFFGAAILLIVLDAASNGDEYEWFSLLMFVLVTTFCSAMLASAIVTFAARVKAGTWWKNTLIYRILCFIKKFFVLCFKGVRYVFKHLPLIWQTLVLLLLLKVVEFAFLVAGYSTFSYFWLCEFAVSVWLVIYIVIALRKLQKAAKEMAGGNLDYRADLAHMPKILREHGENLNNIGEGLKTALSEQIKSEHMKAELITNVSHDIKTPLTSIVNYVGLLKKDGLESESAPEYLEVLERQAAKLKKLTEDLIDASKATSGCIKVNAEKMDINVLLAQASGEYEGKFSQKELIPVLSLSEENPQIFADGGLVWRVFDNLFNNICKYSQKGTRVYLKSEVRGERVIISFSNISEAQLDISSDELMERFVRGDSSRNTEGSGLGLSIARSLVELQGGTFDIKIDGDLFKVEVAFDTIK
ncbi:MAG: HAMP domain-containing histidine kinase [Clostridia bacterium]|nr:HAMP domain-containing histidine kinase [Clostridia bacterium]